MKKLAALLLSLSLALTMMGCTTTSSDGKKEEDQKQEITETITLHFTIIDASNEEEKILFDEDVTVSAGCETLADVLTNVPELELTSQSGAYGLTILGLMGVEGDWNRGPWWLYSSENNASCVEAGYCDAADSLKVADGDSFTFILTSEF